ncbi:hypothetical protein ACROYT_G002123 [Oculina patagonica]
MAIRLRIITVLIFLSYKYPNASGQSPSLGECHNKWLGMIGGYILDRDITSSSVQNASTPAKNARWNYVKGSSWCAATNDSKPYLQIDLERLYIICAVSTQGNSQGDQWVKTYTLQSSTDGLTWKDYVAAGMIFTGNFDRNTRVKHILCSGIAGRGLRIYPQDVHGSCCMRIELYGEPMARVNVARYKPTAQSSIYDRSYSDFAVDGDKTNNHFLYRKCTHTKDPGSTDPWWRVDLEELLPVFEVYILNRAGCCGDRLSGFEIRVGNEAASGGLNNHLCASNLSVPQDKGKYFRCSPTVYGRYVHIRIPGAKKILTLCEVEVYSTPARNLALNQPAIQSSTRSIQSWKCSRWK